MDQVEVIKAEVEALANQRIDEVLRLLLSRFGKASETSIHDKLERYVSLKLITHRMKKRIDRDWDHIYQETFDRYDFLKTKTQEARKDYHDAKHRYRN